MRRHQSFVALAAACLVGCAGAGREADQPGTASATTASGVSAVLSPTTSAVAPPPVRVATTGRDGSRAADGACARPPTAQPDPLRPRYAMRLEVRLDEGVVVGTLAVRFVPDLAVDRLVFRLWANAPRLAAAGGRLDVGTVTVDGRESVGTQPDATTLVVPLTLPRSAGVEIQAAMPFVLRLPGGVSDRIARHGDSLRLGSFFPILAWEPGVGWATEPPTAGFAEAGTSPVADFDVAVALPPGVGALASGSLGADGHFRARAVRDFALSVGRFRVATGTARAPDPVVVQVGVAEGIPEAPESYLAREIELLESMASRYGAYPWPSFTLAVTPGLRGGIEYPGHVMQGPGRSGRTTTHEVAHQWFYALVGNNQGRDPWLDEGLASWAEARLDGTLAAFLRRSVPPAVRGHLGEPMSWWDGHLTSYYRGVYVQTVQALATATSPDAVDCALARYVARHAYRIARSADLVAALDEVAPGASGVLERFGVRP